MLLVPIEGALFEHLIQLIFLQVQSNMCSAVAELDDEVARPCVEQSLADVFVDRRLIKVSKARSHG